MCIRDYFYPDQFEACVMQREQMMQTDFCGRIAMPHPYIPVTEETFVCVSVLKKPIHWYAHDVKVALIPADIYSGINGEGLADRFPD